MNRWIVGSGLLLSLLVLWGVLSEPQVDPDEAITEIEETAQTKPHRPSAAVQYESVQKKAVVNNAKTVQPVRQKTQAKKLTLDEGVLYQGTDVSHRYGFQVIDAAMPSVKDRKKFTVQGEIDGHRFVLKIPANAMNDPLQLRIVDRKSKRVKTVELGTGNDFDTGQGAAKLQMAFSDPQSYEVVYNDVNSKVFP